ncbi:MAG: hypothetical protein EXR69_04545 [Myxococcales bacterium]|nr:hypothetical protein [Myxococcales bacterium]
MHLWLLLACASSSSQSPPLPAPYRLVGLADDSHMPFPALPGGAELLGPACFAVNQRLTAMDARHPGGGPPCGAERWSDGTRSFDLLWAGDAALFGAVPAAPHPAAPHPAAPHPAAQHDRTAQVSWNAIGPVLAACLGPPLNLPPGGDPGGQRTTDGVSWTISLTGKNRCRLVGRLELNIYADRANVHEITVDGHAWSAGGAERALKGLSGEPADAPDVR